MSMTILRKVYGLPQEHGSWIWWIGPFIIGLAAAGRVTTNTAWLLAAVLSGFLLRQPAVILVKALSGRRPRTDLAPAAFWFSIYAAAGLASALALALAGEGAVLALVVPGLLVFAWHLWLVGRREDRGQMGVEIVGAGVLALAAPAAYLVAGGPSGTLPWVLWFLCWLQSASSIVLVYFRLAERRLTEIPPLADRMRAARRAYLYHTFNLIAVMVLAAIGWIPWLWSIGFGLMLLDLIDASLRPAVGLRPTTIGIRQLLASSIFTLLAAASFVA
jgi:hypothetical protein